MKKFIEKICDKYKLVIQDEFTEGCCSEAVFKVLDKNNTPLVLKAAIGNKVLVEEIKMNKVSYEKISSIGLDWFIPNVIYYEATEKFAIMIMEYCGENFYRFIRKVEHPIEYYLLLVNKLEKVYIQTRREGDDGKEMILKIIKMIKELYEEYIYMIFDKQRILADQLEKIKLSFDPSILKFCCFSDWDFKPDDVYLTSTGIKYSDPRNDIMGIPIIDMGSFAGLIKTYNFPEANKGYEILKKFAIEKIAKILFIPKNEAIKIFNLGGLFQCFMSARFRFESNPKLAHEAFLNSKLHIGKII